MVDGIVKIMEQRKDESTVLVVLPKPCVTVLFVGPFVLKEVLVRKAEKWKEKMKLEYHIEVDLHIANPSFQTEDIE